MSATGAIAFGLVFLAVGVLAGLALLLVDSDDDEIDHQEYNDWERIRGLPPAAIPARTADSAPELEQCDPAAAADRAVPAGEAFSALVTARPPHRTIEG